MRFCGKIQDIRKKEGRKNIMNARMKKKKSKQNTNQGLYEKSRQEAAKKNNTGESKMEIVEENKEKEMNVENMTEEKQSIPEEKSIVESPRKIEAQNITSTLMGNIINDFRRIAKNNPEDKCLKISIGLNGSDCAYIGKNNAYIHHSLLYRINLDSLEQGLKEEGIQIIPKYDERNQLTDIICIKGVEATEVLEGTNGRDSKKFGINGLNITGAFTRMSETSYAMDRKSSERITKQTLVLKGGESQQEDSIKTDLPPISTACSENPKTLDGFMSYLKETSDIDEEPKKGIGHKFLQKVFSKRR